MLLHKPRYGMSGRSQIKIIVGKVTEIKLQQWKIYTHTNKLIWLVRSSRRRSRICNCGRFSFLFYNIYRQTARHNTNYALSRKFKKEHNSFTQHIT